MNNAGTGLQHNVSADTVVDTNLYGPKRVVESFLPLLNSESGRIVNVGSGAGPMFMKGYATDAEKKVLMNPQASWAEIESLVNARKSVEGGLEAKASYGLSKAALATYTMELAKLHPNITSSVLSPGFIDRAIVRGWGASKPPEEGTVSLRHCLFQPLEGNGFFYGSDALRSPLHVLRNPGQPVYTGEGCADWPL